MSQQEYDAIINDRTKVIEADIVWEGAGNSLTREFRMDIASDEGHPIFVKGWYNPRSGKLSSPSSTEPWVAESTAWIWGQNITILMANP
jgi:hypothetical protein